MSNNKNIPEIIEKIWMILVILVGSAILGSVLLIGAYCLPTERIAQNVNSGVETLLVEGATFDYASGYKAAILDNVTDAIMLSEAVYPAKHPLKDAMAVPKLEYEGRESPELSLMAYLNNDNLSECVVSTYPRYWHGYLIFLKPFFTIFDFSDSRMFNLAIQIILAAIAIYWLEKQKMRYYVLPLLLVLVLWNPASTGMCMQYYACFYISFLAVIVLLWKKDYLLYDSFRYHLFFMVIGISTSYFDFLTYPIVTLGLPLTIWLLLMREEHKKVIRLFTNCVFWGIGYLGMWMEKWLISSVVLQQNIVLDAIKNVLTRTSIDIGEKSISRIGTIIYLFKTLIKWPYVIIFGGVFIGLIIIGKKRLACKSGYNYKKKVLELIPFILIALLPCIWFFITANHSYIHPRLVYRSWGVSLFALFSGIIYFIQDDIPKKQ